MCFYRFWLRFFSLSLIFLVSLFGICNDSFSDSKKVTRKRNAPSISAFSLLNGVSGEAIPEFGDIKSSITIDSKKLKSKLVDLKIKKGKGRIYSVKYTYSAKQKSGTNKEFQVIRNRRPFSLMRSDNKKYQDWVLDNGTYEIQAVAYNKRRARGKRSSKFSASIIVDDGDSKKDNNKKENKKKEKKQKEEEVIVSPTPELPISTTNDFCIWANDGGDKVVSEDLRASRQGAESVKNSVWDGSKINIFAAKNETVSFNLVVEAPYKDLTNVFVKLDSLSDGKGNAITTRDVEGNGVFNYVGRNIEIFTIRYLTIKGLSILGYESSYDERHVPARLRRSYKAKNGRGSGVWTDRHDHDKSYPDIAVPQEISGAVTVSQGSNQSFWFDIYVPKEMPAGNYSGEVKVYSDSDVIQTVPVELQVKNFSLPEVSYAKTMLYFCYADVSKRYVGKQWPQRNSDIEEVRRIRDRHFQMAHRHRISMIDSNDMGSVDIPADEWKARLDGTLFTAKNGYEGPGVGQGNGVYSVGTYGAWRWRNGSEADFHSHADKIVNWFQANAPTTEYFLYLIDESRDYNLINTWINKYRSNTGIGKNLRLFATIPANIAKEQTPNLDIVASTRGLGIPRDWASSTEYFRNKSGGDIYFYNGVRPQSGSFMTEDDGVALRQVAWTQYKMNISRWFYWESTYYNNFQASAGETNVFKQARTFGKFTSVDSVLGETGWNYSNGDGVLFYPGTDNVYPEESYDVSGPIASLRLKHWRRGIQDVDYLNLAAAKNPEKVKEIVSRIIPKVLWEYGVEDENDPTYIHTDISWSNDPDVWESARSELANIIEG